MFKKIYSELVLIRTELIAIRKGLQSLRKAMEPVERKRGYIMVGIDWCGENEADFSRMTGCEKRKYYADNKKLQDVIREYRQSRQCQSGHTWAKFYADNHDRPR